MYPASHSIAECGAHSLLAILAPHTQTKGPASGFIIDPTSGALLLNSAAAVTAAQIYAQLRGYGPQEEDFQCGGYSRAFFEGRCAMSIGTLEAFKVCLGFGVLGGVQGVFGTNMKFDIWTGCYGGVEQLAAPTNQ